MTEIREALRSAEQRLAGSSESPRRDAEILLGSVLDLPRASLYARPEMPIPAAVLDRYEASIQARKAGAPIAYLVGTREFWSLPLTVTPAVLIPRPETEILVEQALALSATRLSGSALDLGAGSGAVSLAFAVERRDWLIVGVERSTAAVQVAESNRRRLGIENARFVTGDWYRALGRFQFDLILANPPYVSSTDPHLAQGDLRIEPRLALDGGADGLAALRVIVAAAPDHLRPSGWLVVEHGASQGSAVRALMYGAGFGSVRTRNDYAGLERVTCGHWPADPARAS